MAIDNKMPEESDDSEYDGSDEFGQEVNDYNTVDLE